MTARQLDVLKFLIEEKRYGPNAKTRGREPKTPLELVVDHDPLPLCRDYLDNLDYLHYLHYLDSHAQT